MHPSQLDQPFSLVRAHTDSRRIMAVGYRVNKRRLRAATENALEMFDVHPGFNVGSDRRHSRLVWFEDLLESGVGALFEHHAFSGIEQQARSEERRVGKGGR